MNLIRLTFLFLIVIAISGCLSSTAKAPDQLAQKYNNQVVLYATEWCGYCKKTRELFATHNIDYIEHDIEQSIEGKKEFDLLNGRGVPLVLVAGKAVHGYAPKDVLKLAGKN